MTRARTPDPRVAQFANVGRGWRPLLDDLHERLLTRWPGYELQQVKEKFGTLRFYASPGPYPGADGDCDACTEAFRLWREEFQAAIRDAEASSATVCEYCGAHASRGQTKTLCGPCELVHRHQLLAGLGDGERDRFLITTPTFTEAAQVAARLDWWLHAWQWEQGTYGIADRGDSP